MHGPGADIAVVGAGGRHDHGRGDEHEAGRHVARRPARCRRQRVRVPRRIPRGYAGADRRHHRVRGHAGPRPARDGDDRRPRRRQDKGDGPSGLPVGRGPRRDAPVGDGRRDDRPHGAPRRTPAVAETSCGVEVAAVTARILPLGGDQRQPRHKSCVMAK